MSSMTESKATPKRSQFIRKVMPWVVSIGILVYLLNKIPFTDVYAASTRVNLWMFIPIVLIGSLTYLALDQVFDYEMQRDNF